MRKLIAKLFAGSRPPAPATKVTLSLSAMEDRYAPAGLVNPGTIRGFNPQPDPPGDVVLVRTIIAINPGTDRGFVIEGG